MLKIFPNEMAVAVAIAQAMKQDLETLEQSVFCLAAGSTPAKGYAKFCEEMVGHPDVATLKFVGLDEWVGISAISEGSCYRMLDADVFTPLNIDASQITFFDGMAEDLNTMCLEIDQFVEVNPITFSLMGVGMNGHIGLNEPGFPVMHKSSVVALSDTTKEVAQKYFDEPTCLKKGLTLGLGQIVASKRVIVVLTGAHKAQIVKEIFSNEEANLPAQYLLNHPHIDFFLDEAAAQYLNENERS